MNTRGTQEVMCGNTRGTQEGLCSSTRGIFCVSSTGGYRGILYELNYVGLICVVEYSTG